MSPPYIRTGGLKKEQAAKNKREQGAGIKNFE